MTPEEAFEDGKSFGQSDSGAAAVKGAISDSTAVDSVPNYGTAHAHSSYYGAGDGDPRTPGGARVSECASVTYGDAKQQAECDAINDLANNRSNRPPLVIDPADPILVQGATVKADPAAVAGAFGGAYGECRTTTVTQPATYEEELCNEYKTLGEEVCHKTLSVKVTVDQSCEPGTWLPATCVITDQFGNCQGTVQTYCEPGRGDGKLRIKFTPVNLHGICRLAELELPTVPFTVAASEQVAGYWRTDCYGDGDCTSTWSVENAIALFINHWKGACTVAYATGFQTGPQGCADNVCTYTFRTFESGAGASLGTCMPKVSGWASCQVDSGGPRWGHQTETDYRIVKPGMLVTETDTWDDQCVLFEARTQ
jgi:hypothetical protein